MRLSRINSLLLILIVIVNLYVIITPFVPVLTYTVASHSGRRQALQQKIHAAPSSPAAAQANSVVIPSMLLDQPVLEGHDTYAVLNRGILHWPASSTPDKGGNTVLLGHRFTYSLPKGVFYDLDKVKIGDEIGLSWNGTQYIYKVTGTKIVSPTDTSIEATTSEPRLTLFTCTPLWWPKDRLVVIATPEATP